VSVRVAFVTGGSGLVGSALVPLLVERGYHVLALARSRTAAGKVEGAGAEPVFGDLARPEGWAAELRAADVVWHLALPRLGPPVRRLRASRLAREAGRAAAGLRAALGDRPLVALSSTLVYGSRADRPAREDDPPAPLALAGAALATERALAGPELRVVRLPWVYGPTGLIWDAARGLREGRFRVVGAGDNRWPMISAPDAAAALLAASEGPPGVYHAAEPAAPTQIEVVTALCTAARARRPDHLPERMASLSMGGAVAQAFASNLELDCARLGDLGWRPGDSWRRDLVRRLERPPTR